MNSKEIEYMYARPASGFYLSYCRILKKKSKKNMNEIVVYRIE